jgi:hypothetical protein
MNFVFYNIYKYFIIIHININMIETNKFINLIISIMDKLK